MSLALDPNVKAHLDGERGSSPLAGLAAKTKLGTRLDELVTLNDALAAENTDGQLPIPLLRGLADGGTYTPAISATGVRTITRTAADAVDSFWVEVPVENRTAAGKGIKPTGVRVSYSVGTAAADDIRFELYRRTVPADNAAPAVPVLLGGDLDAHYDAAHNTAAERGDATGAPEQHTLVMTLPTPTYLGTDEQLLLRCFCDGALTSVIVITDAVLLFDETRVDVS